MTRLNLVPLQLVSHRHAARDGYDLLIWSLLIGDIEEDSSMVIWERQTGKRIPSSKLAPSTQRTPNHLGVYEYRRSMSPRISMARSIADYATQRPQENPCFVSQIARLGRRDLEFTR